MKKHTELSIDDNIKEEFSRSTAFSRLIRIIPHIAFVVDDLNKELKKNDFEIISEADMPSE